MNIGERLRKLRKSRRLTLDDISRKCGVGKATLSRIENNITAGTLRTHMKICQAININLRDLYEGIDLHGEEIAPLGEKLTEQAEIFSYDEKAKSIILTKNSRQKNMLPQLLLLEPDGKTHIEQNVTGAEKFIFCTEGQVQVELDKKPYQLKKGTSLYFYTSLPHRIINIGKNPAKCIVVTSPVAL